MPVYDYRCKTCGEYFEEFQTIANRLEPTKESHYHGCKTSDAKCELELAITKAAGIGDPIHLGLKKPDGAFTEHLQKINKAYRGDMQF